MRNHRWGAAALLLAATACSSSDSGGRGPAMMDSGSGSGYRFSQLTCSAPADLPGARVDVLLGDMGMSRMMGGRAPLDMRMMLRAAPAAAPAGRISLVASNRGWRTHELVILPLATDGSAGQRVPGPDGRVEEAGSVGEASTSCGAGAGDGIRPGAVSWTTLSLAPGHYELVCNLPNHYADGMHQQLDVRAP